jgi:AAA domain
MAKSILDLSLAEIARILGGKVYGNGSKRYILAPAPGHSAKDESLKVDIGPNHPDGFVVHSFCGEDELKLKDSVREKLSLPAFSKSNGKRRPTKKSPVPAPPIQDPKPIPESIDGLTPDERLEAAISGGSSAWTPENVAGLKFVESYPYTDASGKVIYQNCRYLKDNGAGPKTFLQWRLVGSRWIKGLAGIEQFPYRLDEIQKSIEAPIFICEGEKDADTLRSRGHCATNCASGQWETVRKYFKGRETVILADFNKPGTVRALEAATALHDTARNIRFIFLPGLDGGDNNKDVTDWISNPENEKKFADICRHAPLWTPGAIVEGFAEAELVVKHKSEEVSLELGEWDAGEDSITPPPRGWLLGNSFCRGFVSSLLGSGGVGKTALRYAQMLSLAAFVALTGEHVFQRCRVLIVSLEDGPDELRRRILAARIHHNIERSQIAGWLFLSALGKKDGKLMTLDDHGRPIVSHLATKLAHTIAKRKIDVVLLDPFIKTHTLNENDNSGIDEVAQILTDLCGRFNIALDIPHHMSKGVGDPGNPNKGRGASSLNDALRLVRTANVMTDDEAKKFGLTETERRRIFRVDDAKLNIAPVNDAKWYKLVGIKLDNATKLYPNGDDVQTVETWTPPNLLADLSIPTIHAILNEIDAGLPDGNRYSDAKNVADIRAAWSVVKRHCEKEQGPSKEIVKTWVESGLLVRRQYTNPESRKNVAGLWVDNSKRPS